MANAGPAAETVGCLRIAGARLPGGAPFEAVVRDGRLVTLDAACARELDARGSFVVPAFVDAHVHLEYLPAEEALARAGVAAAVDLAAPIESLGEQRAGPLRVLHAGPMITATGGYPTRSWGADGYGLPCDGAAACAAAVDRVADAGADLVKVPLAGPPEHDDETLRAIVERAHARGLRVAVHALTDVAARRAADAGADLLAHTPTEPLSEATVRALADRAVVSTLAAFGGSEAAIENLRRLRAAGATVLYGTDLGNTRTAAIDARELALLARAGMSPRDVVDAGTAAPARFFGLEGLGALEPGAAASLLLLDADPLAHPETLTRPVHVLLDGVIVR